MESYKAAVLQMNSQPDIDHNLAQASELITQAVQNGALLAAMPENFAFLGDFDLRMEKADEISSRAEAFLKKEASEHGIYILGGSFPVPSGNGKNYNQSLLLNPDGETVARYDKIHLFDVDLEDGESYRESDYVEPGELKPMVYRSQRIGNLGLSVCYDLRFPELYKSLTDEGAEVLTVPSAFTQTTGEVHWEILLRARAIENTGYVVAPAQTGTHGADRKTYGHSMIVDPWGKILADAGDEVGVATAEINPERMKEVRRSILSIKHRRF